MGDDDRRPPRPSISILQGMFLKEWYEDRSNGISPRLMHKTLQDHIIEDRGFQGETLGRLAALEKSEERNSEERMLDGRAAIVPPPPKMPSFRPWWGQEPWKSVIRYALIVLISLAAGAAMHKWGVQAAPTPPSPLTSPSEHAH